MTTKEAFDLLRRFFAGFEESNLYEDYLECEELTDGEYDEAWLVLEDHFAEE